jgi:membrane protein
MARLTKFLERRENSVPVTELDELAAAMPALRPLTKRLTILKKRDDTIGSLARFTVSSLPFGCWVRYVKISGRDRLLALAGQTFTAIIPLMIVVAAWAPHDDALPKYLVEKYGLTGAAADAVNLLFSRPPGSTGAITVFGAIVLFYSLVSLTRAMQRLFEAAWELEPTGVRGTIDALSGFSLLLAQVIVLALIGSLVRGAALGTLLVMTLRVCVAVVLWLQLQYLLLSRRIPRRELLPGALVAGAGQVVVSLYSAIWMPHLLTTNAQRYGVIGVTFAILTWMIVLGACLVAAAVISAEVGLRRRRFAAMVPAQQIVQPQPLERTAEKPAEEPAEKPTAESAEEPDGAR